MFSRKEFVNSGFVHSVKVPRLYKTASLIVKRVVENGESLKQLVYSSRHKNVKGLYALVVETIKHSQALDKLLKKSKLLEKESRLEPWLARILITEMLYRNKELKGTSKPVQTIISYREKLMKFMDKNKNDRSSAKVIKPRYVRVNTLQYTPDEVIKMFRDEGWIFLQSCSDYESFLETVTNLKDDEFMKDFHVKEMLVFPPSAQFYKNELYLNGSIVLQDKASCLPVCLLQPTPNSTVLDMCSAPGMKTTHLSARMKNKGTIYAVELNQRRYETLCDLVKNTGCTNVKPINMDALLIGQNDETSWSKDVEYILVDPSCSGTGMVDRRNVFLNEQKDNQRIKKLCAFQFKLLMHALTNFPNAKRVVYSTCSVLTVENEKVVDDVLRKLSQSDCPSEFELVDAMKESWPTRGSEDYEIGKHCLYADPEKDQTNGFFVAVFQRRESKGESEEPKKKKNRSNI
ncbi:UNVERIFIED_CONTAM: hypothetical protein PYX00_010553 [Menopon gallinae]|uniref:SAM-dependent MTase RsmB/NOP-type domain-containing protein n=1 Tax=Menopon gallinae TaxID=328185 RepID=A0AAW2HFY5_9NEOP